MKRRRRRKQQEAAILVESLIVIGMLITALECVWTLYRFCLSQHQAQLDARMGAWQTSLQGCGESKLSGVLGALAGSDDGSNVGEMRENGAHAPGWVKVGSANEGAVHLDVSAPVLGKSGVSARQHFACNEHGNPEPLQLFGADDARDNALHASEEQGK